VRQGTAVVAVAGLLLVGGCKEGSSTAERLTASPTPSVTPALPSPTPMATSTNRPTASPTPVRPTVSSEPTLPPAPTRPVGFSAASVVGKAGCGDSHTVVDADGLTRGFMVCTTPDGEGALYYVASAAFGSRWHLTRVASGRTVLDVADDGSTTYGLVDNGSALEVFARTHAGVVKVTRLADTGDGSDVEGAITARQGKWWALWSEASGDCACFPLYEARTMGTPLKAHDTGKVGREMRLVAVSDTAVEVVRDTRPGAIAGSIVVTRVDGAGWHKDTYLEGTQAPDSGSGFQPDVIQVGEVTEVTWIRMDATVRDAYKVMYADNASKAWRTHAFTVPAAFPKGALVTWRPAYLVASRDRTAVGWTTVVGGRSVAHLAERVGKRWVEADLPSGIANRSSFLSGLGAWQGRLQCVFDVVDDATNQDTTVVRHQ
jgi:hypothetical protein